VALILLWVAAVVASLIRRVEAAREMRRKIKAYLDPDDQVPLLR
jgi:hypothetical protein